MRALQIQIRNPTFLFSCIQELEINYHKSIWNQNNEKLIIQLIQKVWLVGSHFGNRTPQPNPKLISFGSPVRSIECLPKIQQLIVDPFQGYLIPFFHDKVSFSHVFLLWIFLSTCLRFSHKISHFFPAMHFCFFPRLASFSS